MHTIYIYGKLNMGHYNQYMDLTIRYYYTLIH